MIKTQTRRDDEQHFLKILKFSEYPQEEKNHYYPERQPIWRLGSKKKVPQKTIKNIKNLLVKEEIPPKKYKKTYWWYPKKTRATQLPLPPRWTRLMDPMARRLRSQRSCLAKKNIQHPRTLCCNQAEEWQKSEKS